MSLLHLRYQPSDTGYAPVTLPLSKSIAARVAILRFLTDNQTVVDEWPDCDDTRELLHALKEYGEAVCAGKDYTEVHMGVGGTTFRFFAAVAACMPGMDALLTCGEQLKRRPILPLVEALRRMGGKVDFVERYGYPPLMVKGDRLEGGLIDIDSGVSSQFVSALMMIAPYWKKGGILKMLGHAVSTPYIRMTAGVMRQFGANVTFEPGRIIIPAMPYTPPAKLEIESDWSAASYFYELSMLMPGREIRLSCLTPPSLSSQGDSGCMAIYQLLGVNTEFLADGGAILGSDPAIAEAFRKSPAPLELDFNDMPDLVPSVAVALCLSDIRFVFHGIGHLRHKESDRVMALESELGKLGYGLESDEDSMSWLGARVPEADEKITTYGDHRIAMAFAPVAVKRGNVTIEDPSVVGKSFPRYWTEIAKSGIEPV